MDNNSTMSRADEARYVRMCLLVLNVCPFTLRHVIDDYSLRHDGSLSLYDFLDKHSLFHLYAKRCCCRHLQQNRSTPMTKRQWDLLFISIPNYPSCQRDRQMDCPCKYQASASITTKDMDVTLCCLVINNICPGVDTSHIDTIKEIRNNLIHSTNASLDLRTFNGYWNRVKTSLRLLAQRVLPTLIMDTMSRITELESRLMNLDELQQLRNLILDERRIENIETNMVEMETRETRTRAIIEQMNISFLRQQMNQGEQGRQIGEQGRQIGEQGRQIDGHGKQIDGHGRQIGEQGRQIGEQGRQIGDHGRQIDSHGRQIGEQGRQIGEQGRQIGEQGRQIGDHGRQIDSHGRQIGEQGRQIGEQGRQIGEQGRHIGDHSRQIDDHDRLIDDHGRQIDDHGRHIDGHGRQIDEHDRQIDDHGRQIADIQQRISYGRVTSSPDRRTGVRKMKEKLMEINDELTRVIQLSPLQDIEEGLPIELLYASVVIQKYQKYATTGYDSSQILGELIRKGEFRRMLRASELGAEHTSDFDIGSYTYERSNIRVSHPDDIFRKEGQYARKIYMLGDAAYGKTTYCIWLLRKWCAAKRKEEMGQENFDQWEKELKKFDFAFLMNFRNVDINQDSVVDMICQDAFESEKGCHGVIRDVLSSDKYKSLIIMDGLDEWSSRKNNKMPKIDVSDNVTCFISMRPWVFPILSDKRYRGRVIKILGLSETGVINVIKNVLINHYKVREHSQKYTDTIDKLESETLGSFMHIPLLVVVCVQICYKAKHIRSSMTSFYAEMLNMLIERANEKHTNEIKPEQTDNRDLDLPKILAVYDHIKNCSSVLLKLGDLAYRNLLTNETNLIFQKIKLENEIGLRNLQFALNVGLISQKEARSLTTKNVSVHFFHKSIQELLAVIYIVTNKEVGDSFCRHLSDVNVVMNLSNVIMFICGMCPSLGSVISQRVVSVTDSCTKICKSPQRDDTVEKLYKLQVTWFRELRHEQTNLKFYLSYVYLVEESDAQTVNGTKELLSDKHVDIKSLFLFFVPTCGERCISNTELNAFLCNEHTNTMSLTMIYINSKSDHKRSVQKICAPNLNTLYLYNITCTPLLSEMTLLRELVLFEVSMGDNRLDIPANIAKIRLSKIKMSVSKWKSFLNSLLDINPNLNVTVELNETNIDVESKAEIESSPDFRITQGSDHCMLDFTRIGKQ